MVEAKAVAGVVEAEAVAGVVEAEPVESVVGADGGFNRHMRRCWGDSTSAPFGSL